MLKWNPHRTGQIKDEVCLVALAKIKLNFYTYFAVKWVTWLTFHGINNIVLLTTYIVYDNCYRSLVNESVQKTAAGPRQHNCSWHRTPSGAMVMFFLSRLIPVFKWGLPFNEKRDLTTPVTPPLRELLIKILSYTVIPFFWSAYHTIITAACSAKAIYEYVRRFIFLADISNHLRGFRCIRSP